MDDSASTSTTQIQNPKNRWLVFFQRRARVLAVGLAVVAVLQMFRQRHWALDLTTHMQAHLLVAAVCVLAFFLLARQWRWLLVSLVLVSFGCWTVKPWGFWIAAAPAELTASDLNTDRNPRLLRLLIWNAFVRNPDPQSVARFAVESDADVVAILEWTNRLGEAFKDVRASHPHFLERPAGGAFGIAMYSRLPGQIEAITLPGDVLALRFRPHDERLPVDVWAVHTLPPMGPERLSIRDRQLSALGGLVRADPQRLPIVSGDLNVTPWADQYQQMLRVAGLVDSRAGFGYAATWPSRLGRLGIPIDQIAVDPTLQVIQRSVQFASRGSDHAAVEITLELP